jgi:L-asparagine oxygenase
MQKILSQKLNPFLIFKTVCQKKIKVFSTFVKASMNKEVTNAIRELVKQENKNPYEQYLDVQAVSTDILKKAMSKKNRKLLDVIANKGKTSLILFKNCPVFDKNGLPNTPNIDSQPKTKDYVSEYFMLGIGGLLNAKPHVVKNEKDGNVIQQLIPLNPKQISGTGSKLPFNLHTENSHEQNPLDVFLLLCLRGDHNAKTTYCLLDDLLTSMPEWVIKEMEKPNFIFRTGDSFNVKEESQGSILTMNKLGIYEIKFNSAPNRCDALTPASQKALDYLKTHLENGLDVHHVTLTHGDMLVINNKRMLHGRSAFDISTFPEEKRWLQRIYLKS